MATLVASPLMFNPRNVDTASAAAAADHTSSPLTHSTTNSTSVNDVLRRDIFASAIAQAEQGTGQNALARLTSNPVLFVEASDPTPSSLAATIIGNSKFELLDDSKVSSAEDSSASGAKAAVNDVKKPFIGPIIPANIKKELEREEPTSEPSASSSSSSAPVPPKILYSREIPTTWPTLAGTTPKSIGKGLDNVGNTCFLNSVLQCLLHTPGLLHIVIDHRVKHGNTCPTKGSSGFCMLCQFCELAWMDFYGQNKRASFQPSAILNSLGKIAKGLRRGRQEDAHEFLRYSIDAFQKAALSGLDPKLPHSVKETTWVHKLFGGRLRSRVTCQVCHHNSDTFDSLLDLSIDVKGKDSVRDALESFVAIERLAGADKYKCEKCKKPVVAEKRFTIHDAPQVLTVHLKRFTPMGKKLTQPVKYGETLSLQRYMSEGQFGPNYDLYGVICHQGGGPNSGHYYAYVKSPRGQWYEMNDEEVRSTNVFAVRNAYLLFYMRKTGSSLQSAIQNPSTASSSYRAGGGLPSPSPSGGLAAPAEIFSASDRAEKRKREQAANGDGDDDEDLGVKASPLGVSNGTSPASKKQKLEEISDPAAAALRARIDAALGHGPRVAPTPKLVLASTLAGNSTVKKDAKGLLSEYIDDSSGPEDAEMLGPIADESTRLASPLPDDTTIAAPSTPTRSPTQPLNTSSIFPTPPLSHTPRSPVASTSTQRPADIVPSIPPVSFYGSTNNASSSSSSKGKHRSTSDENDRPFGHNRSGSSQQQSSSSSNHHHSHHRRDSENDGGGRGGYSRDRDRDRGRGGGHRKKHRPSGENPFNSLSGGPTRQKMNRRKPMM